MHPAARAIINFLGKPVIMTPKITVESVPERYDIHNMISTVTTFYCHFFQSSVEEA